MSAKRSESSPAVSLSPIGVGKRSSIHPVSMPSSIRMSVIPVSRSPRTMAHVTGAAPRYFGRSDAWTFTHPSRGPVSTSDGRMRP